MATVVCAILRFLLNLIYLPMKLFAVNDNKVLFLSRQSNTPTEDFKCLADELKKQNPDVKIVMITKRADKGAKNLIVFAWDTFLSMCHLATARVCVLDAYWPAVSILHHKKKLCVVQLWHAMGKIKKSGYQTLGKGLGRSEAVARGMRMHRNYDVIIAGGRAFNPFYCASFDVSPEILYNVGLPRMDLLRENVSACREEFYSAYPELEGKKIVLYAPTFRKGELLDPEAIVKAFPDDGKSVLIIKHHPNQELVSEHLGCALTCDEVKTSTVLSVCDCVITDYSAITIEAAVLDKPVYFYLFDFEDYLSRNGLNVLLSDEFPKSVFYEPEALFDCIEHTPYDRQTFESFRKKYLPDQTGRATDKIAALIIDCLRRNKNEAISERISAQNRADSSVDSEDSVRS